MWCYHKIDFNETSGSKGVIFVISQKVNGNMIFTDYWNFLLLNFSGMRMGMGIRSVFELKEWWKDDIYRKVLRFKFSVMGKVVFYYSQNFDGKIFAWSFCAFYDISGLRKYGFLRIDFFSINISELFIVISLYVFSNFVNNQIFSCFCYFLNCSKQF